MPPKPKTNQPETPKNIQVRDSFWTPAYGTDLLIPFIPKNVGVIWECASGEKKKISIVLETHGYDTISTDLLFGNNFLEDKPDFKFDCIITNPPFSLKRKFYDKCLEYKKSFALLIPADYSSWICDSIDIKGCEKIIPKRRIDYITPNILDNVWKGETKKLIENETRQKFKNYFSIPDDLKNKYSNRIKKYNSIEECPNELLAKYSTSQFHSMWLTWGFGLGKSETFVELTKEMKQNI